MPARFSVIAVADRSYMFKTVVGSPFKGDTGNKLFCRRLRLLLQEISYRDRR